MTKRKSSRSRRPTGALASLVEGKRGGTVLLGDMQQHMVKKNLADNSRRQDIIHPSELAKEYVCPRQIVYRISGQEPTDSKKEHTVGLLAIFEEGHAQHSKYQNLLVDMGRMWGDWKCRNCGTVVTASLEPPAGSECQCDQWEYQEVGLDAEVVWGMRGHADGAVPDLEAFIEIKTIGLGTLRMEEPELVKKHTHKTTDGKTVTDMDGLWKDIKRPLKPHRNQANLYLAIANELGLPFNKMIFIYENKANQMTKEFVMPFSERAVEPLIDTAKDIKYAVDHDKELPRPDWAEKEHKECRDCPFRSLCYGEGDEESRSKRSARVPAARRGSAGAARRSDRDGSSRTDDSDASVDGVGELPDDRAGGSRGRRVVRRRSSR
jgi:hypothetical protein